MPKRYTTILFDSGILYEIDFHDTRDEATGWLRERAAENSHEYEGQTYYAEDVDLFLINNQDETFETGFNW